MDAVTGTKEDDLASGMIEYFLHKIEGRQKQFKIYFVAVADHKKRVKSQLPIPMVRSILEILLTYDHKMKHSATGFSIKDAR